MAHQGFAHANSIAPLRRHATKEMAAEDGA
jgi:hypothetical protein